MKKIFLLPLLIVTSCTSLPKDTIVRESPNGCLTIDMSKALKLNGENQSLLELVDSFRLVRLENKEKALIGSSLWGATVIDKYMLIHPNNIAPIKLFTLDGKYISTIGATGQGPGEYFSSYRYTVDESDHIIYLVPFNARRIIAYDFEGRYLPERSIPFPGKAIVPKAQFWIDKKTSRITIVTLVFDEKNKKLPTDKFCWVQDFKGNMQQSIPSKGYEMFPDYSNEVSDNQVENCISFSIFDWNMMRPDTIFHYDISRNRLLPCFTVDVTSQSSPVRLSLQETEGYYWAEIESKPGDKTSIMTIRISKKDHSVKRIKRYIMDDLYLSYKEIFFKAGYITLTYDPCTLMDELDKILNRRDLSENVRRKAQHLRNSLHEDDNDVVFVGKLKKDI